MPLFFRKNKLLVVAFIFQAIIFCASSNVFAQNNPQKPPTQPQAETFEIKEKDLPVTSNKTSKKDDIPLPDFKEFEDDKYINEVLENQPKPTNAGDNNQPNNNVSNPQQPVSGSNETPIDPNVKMDNKNNSPAVAAPLPTGSPTANQAKIIDDILMSPEPNILPPNTQKQLIGQDHQPTAPANVEIPQNKENLLTTDVNSKKEDTLTEKEKQAYQQLTGHLVNFITNFHKGKEDSNINAVQDKKIVDKSNVAQNESPAPQNPTPTPSQPTVQEGKTDNNNQNDLMDDLLDIPNTNEQKAATYPTQNMQGNTISGNVDEKKNKGENQQTNQVLPISAPDITTKEQDILVHSLKSFNKDLSDKDIESIKAKFGNCIQYALNLKECKAFSCSYKENSSSITRNIIGWQDKKCVTSEIIDNNPTNNCSIPEKVMKDVYEFNMLKVTNKKLTKIQEDSLSAINKSNCHTQTPEQRMVTQEPSVKPVEIDEDKEEQQKPVKLSEADKAYLKLLDKQSQNLPAEQRLSPTTKETVAGIASNILPKQKKKEPSYIKIEHGKQNDIIIEDNNTTKNKKKLDITVSNIKDDEDIEKTKEKLEKAYKALIVGQIAAAINTYKEILAKEPSNKDALFGLATSYHKNNQFEQARNIYTQILKKYPNEKEALNNYLVLVAEEAPQDALIELEKLERINSDFSPIPAQIAMIHLKSGNTEKAVRYLRRAILLSPENIIYKYNLAITYDRIGKADSAIQLYRQIIVEVEEKGAVIPGSIDKVNERLRYLESKTEKN